MLYKPSDKASLYLPQSQPELPVERFFLSNDQFNIKHIAFAYSIDTASTISRHSGCQ